MFFETDQASPKKSDQ